MLKFFIFLTLLVPLGKCEGSVTEHLTLHRHNCAEKVLSSSWFAHTVDREDDEVPVLQSSYLWILQLL